MKKGTRGQRRNTYSALEIPESCVDFSNSARVILFVDVVKSNPYVYLILGSINAYRMSIKNTAKT